TNSASVAKSPEKSSEGETTPELIPVPPQALVEKTKEPDAPSKPIATTVPDTTVTSPPSPRDDLEMFRPAVAEIKPSLRLWDLRALDAAALAKDLTKESAYRIELPCADTAKALRRVEAALKEHGFGLVIDQAAQERLARRRGKTNYIIFLEDLTADELAGVLARAGAEDKKAAEAKPKPDGQFSKMVVLRMADADRKQLADLVRTDVKPPAAGARPERA